MRTSLLLILLFALPLQAAGPYYVDPVSGNNGDDGLSEGNAWATITFAYANATAGSTIRLMDGAVYDGEIIQNENLAANSWANKITITKNPGDDPIIQGLLLTRDRHLYLEINDVKFRPLANGDTALEIASVSALRFINLDYQGVWNTNFSDLIEQDPAGYDALSNGISFRDVTVIEDITIQDCNIFSVKRGININCGVGDDWIIKNNEIHRTAETQIRFSPRNSSTGDNGHILVDGNQCHDYFSFFTGIDMSHASGITINGNNITVQNNIVHATGSTSGIASYTGNGEDGVGYSNIIIQNNLVYDNSNPLAVRLYDISATGVYIFRNNTIIGWHEDEVGTEYYLSPVHIRPFGWETGGDESVAASGFEMYNNIVVGRVNFDGAHTGDGGLESIKEDFNYFYSALDTSGNHMSSHDNTTIITTSATDLIFESNFFIAPDFTMAMHRNEIDDGYKLFEDSPAIGIGDITNSPATDLEGNARVTPTAMGCYEFLGEEPEVPTVFYLIVH